MKKLAVTFAMCAGALSACSSPTPTDQLVSYLSETAPKQVQVLSADCDRPFGVCRVLAETRFHSPSPTTVEYLCRVTGDGDDFRADCPDALWLRGSRGTPLGEGVASLLLPPTEAPVQEPCAGLSNIALLTCLYTPNEG